jgi:hypothetical protein
MILVNQNKKGQCTFYCSVQCQKQAWKGGHKQECPTFAQECKDLAKQVVDQMNACDQPRLLRVQGLERLDGEGAYNFAIEYGLHQAIYEMLDEDAEEALRQYQEGDEMDHTFFITWILNSLWRGQRISRRGCTTIRKCDGYRVSRYMKSLPDAFEMFWRAFCATVAVPLDEEVFERCEIMHREVHLQSRDVLASLSQLLTSSRAYKSMLLLRSKNIDADAFQSRMDFIFERLEKNLRILDKIPQERDPRGVNEAYHYQNIAMIMYRMKKHNIDVDTMKGFEKKLKIIKYKYAMYEQIAVPLGEATIDKGYALTNEESTRAMQDAKRRSKSKKKKSNNRRR